MAEVVDAANLLATASLLGVPCLGVELDTHVWVVRVSRLPTASDLREFGDAARALGARWVSVEVCDD